MVDIGAARTVGRSDDKRFVERVFDAEEMDAIRGAPHPDRELWLRWAAKEAGFKAAAKMMGAAPPFAHRSFKVVWEVGRGPGIVCSPEDVREDTRTGSVRYEGHDLAVRVTERSGAVHAVAAWVRDAAYSKVHVWRTVAHVDDPEVWKGNAGTGRLSPKEREGVRSKESVAVRLGARAQLASLLAVHEDRLEVVREITDSGRGPPYLLVDGAVAPVDLSLSHDGRWIAWALWIDPAPAEVA